jgi:flagellum-specific peptidoglycan hydrolase FlgJ
VIALLIAGIVAIMLINSPKKPASGPTRQNFAESFLAAASKVDMRGIPVGIALSVAALESGWGTGRIYQASKNVFSITASAAWRGPKLPVAATGFTFRMYATLSDSIKDWVGLISGSKLYAKTYAAALSGDYKKFFDELQKAGYAGSDLQYSAKLQKTYEVIA